MPTIAGIPLGHSIPYLTPHAVSVSLPTWRDNVDYEEGDKRVVDAMQTGYPRFFVHRSIQKLANVAANHFQSRLKDPSDSCYLYPTARTSQGAVDFLASRTPSISAYTLEWAITEATTIYCVFTDATTGFKTQKQYWQHAGDGISSRLAEDCLHALGIPINPSSPATSTTHLSSPVMRGFSRNKHYSAKSSAALQAIMASTSTHQEDKEHDSANLPGQKEEETTTYIEERYARNLSASQAPLAKLALKRRIAGVLKESSLQQPGTPSTAAAQIASTDVIGTAQTIIAESTAAHEDSLQPSDRGVSGLTEDDVYLYPGGMSAIFHSFTTILHATKKSSKALGKSVCFGFPYTDTLKILEKWGPGCHFFGRGLDSDLASLEDLLQTQHDKHLANPSSTDPEDQPILALYCEFPSNPLLRSPHLQKIKELQDRFGFYIVIDETVGGFINVECLPFASIVVSSLTKIFSGDSNVMGGSLTLNPASQHYKTLKAALDETYEDTYYFSDAIFMERNSRDFISRVGKINANTEAVCDLLNQYTVDSGKSLLSSLSTSAYIANGTHKHKPVVTKVYYPKYITPENYASRLRSSDPSREDMKPGYGSLFSITFTSLACSRAFFDNLKCCKGPSLGTNFTLACPYTVLAHYLELEWAKEWEVEEGLVRVTVGLEDKEVLKEWFEDALRAAELAGQQG